MIARKHSKSNVKAVIMAGQRDFGRCSMAAAVPTALWPVGQVPALERLLRHLNNQSVRSAVVCSNGDAQLLAKSIQLPPSMDVRFLNEQLPVGTAGCLRDAAGTEEDQLLLAMPAAVTFLPDIDRLLSLHQCKDASMTVVFDDPPEHICQYQSAQIYLCNKNIVKHIPSQGYCDIKETLIPSLLRKRLTVATAQLGHCLASFRNCTTYRKAMADYVANDRAICADMPQAKKIGQAWVAGSALIADSAKILGPALIMDAVTIGHNVTIFGPAVLGPQVTVRPNAIIDQSIILKACNCGTGCQVRRSVLTENTHIPDNKHIIDKTIIARRPGIVTQKLTKSARYVAGKFKSALPVGPSAAAQMPKAALPSIVLAAALVWSYMPEFSMLWQIWNRSDEYSSGMLVPLLAIYVIWNRRDSLAEFWPRPAVLAGLVGILAAQAIRYFGLFYMFGSAERFSIVIMIFSVVLMLAGWKLLLKLRAVLLFTVLMLPMPNRVHTALMLPLQEIATRSSVFSLQTLGYGAVNEGNIIHPNGTSVAIAEACNGLRMATAFVVITAWVVLLVKRPPWQKTLILASSLPVAMLCNTIRLTATAVAFTMLDQSRHELFHDFGGYAMMPLALAIVIFQLWFLKILTQKPTLQKPRQRIIRSKTLTAVHNSQV